MIRKRLFAQLYDRLSAGQEEFLHERRAGLLGGLAGTVLEIGPGTGVNFDFLGPDVRWIGVEPNPFMHPFLREKAESRGIPAEFRRSAAEGMEVEDESVDAVVSTLVLCSVERPAQVLRDVRRVLKPGGRFVFLEHVAAPRGSWGRRFQGLARPLWRFLADGCTLDRELEGEIRAAGFRALDVERFRFPRRLSPLPMPCVAGTGVK